MNDSSKKSRVFLPWIILVIVLSVFGCFKIFETKNVSGHTASVPIAMALDDGYTYPTIVAITSIMENANKKTRHDFHIMHPGNFKEENKEKLMSLEKKYDGCHINLIDMEDKYKNANDKGHITTPAYYRLSLSDLLPDLNKIIWLDGDTLTFGDLRPMYEIDMEGYYYKGFLDDTVYGVKDFVDNDHCICSGVMLVNLEELRKDNMVEKFNEFIEKNNDRLIQHDQTTINAVAYKKIGKLPLRYGMFGGYCDFESAKLYRDNLIAKDRYTDEEIIDGLNNLVVVHCVSKPWKYTDVSFFKEWWKYAKKTDFYEEIYKAYPIF